MARRAFETARDYSWDARAERLDALFDEAAGRRAGEEGEDDRDRDLRTAPDDRAVPRLRRAAWLARATTRRACRACGRPVRRAGRLPRPAAEAAFDEQTSYLDEALHADARHERCRRRCSAPASATACCGVPAAGHRAIASSISAAAAGASLVWNQRPRRLDRSASTSARSSRARRASRSTSCSATCGGCRSPTARSRRPTPSTCSSICRARRSPAMLARGGARAGAGRRAVRLHATCGRTRAIALGLRVINRLARRLERVGLIDMTQERLRKSDHLNPLADIPDLERVGRRGRLPHRAHPLLHAARRRLRREHPGAPRRARHGAGAAAGAARGAGRRADGGRDGGATVARAPRVRRERRKSGSRAAGRCSPRCRALTRADEARRACSSAACGRDRSSRCS